MSPIRAITSIRGLLLLLACLTLSACGEPNDRRTFSPETGEHKENWVLSRHMETVLASGNEQCKACHGSDFTGGISNVACFGANGCHIDSAESVHPAAWNFTMTLHGPYSEQVGVESCRNVYCHGANWEGVAGSGFACTFCHNSEVF